jgi:O-acetyl-ADP-ribose deacetylase (regulator of RNase III)
VIHAVGPVWQGGGPSEAELLAGCYHYALRLAAVQSAHSVAFPAISCGAYGYPLVEATTVAVRTVRNFLRTESRIERVLFCCFTNEV